MTHTRPDPDPGDYGEDDEWITLERNCIFMYADNPTDDKHIYMSGSAILPFPMLCRIHADTRRVWPERALPVAEICPDCVRAYRAERDRNKHAATVL